ncbi:MAG: hypothetical protein MHM6MM_000203 [Cercozoa sp. M6MM]
MSLQSTYALRAMVRSLKPKDCRSSVRKRLSTKVEEIADESNEALHACFHTLDIINGILDVAKLEDLDEKDLTTDDIYISDFVREVCAIPRRLAKPGVHIAFELPDTVEAYCFRSNKRLLKQILINLLMQ